MSELSQRSRDLIARGRGGPPSATDRARVRAKLDERLALAVAAAAGVGVAKTASAATAAAAVKGATVAAAPVGVAGLWVKIGVAVVVLGAAGATARFAVERLSAHSPPDTTFAAVATERGPAESGPTEGVQDPTKLGHDGDLPATEPSADDSVVPSPAERASSNEAVASAAPLAPSAARGSAKDPGSIAGEVALLRRAQSSLTSGDPNASLRALDAIDKTHPSGVLREEASAARVLALCAAGKKAEAKAEAARFLAEWPTSVQAGRVRGSCAFASEPAPR